MNIRELRNTLNISQQELANRTGIPKDRIAKWEQGKGKPKTDDDKILEEFFKENVPRNTHVEEPEEKYITSKGVTVIDTQAGAKDYLARRQHLKNNGGTFMVPLVPISAQAGYSKSFTDPVYISDLKTYAILPGIDPHGAAWRYFEVEGDSMEDTFKEGQYLLASQVIKEDWRNIENFYVYVIITDDKVMVKRLAKVKGKDYWACISDNDEKYPQFRLYVSEVKELWKYRRHVDWNAAPKKKFVVNV